jgi:hypothetical protein
MITIPTLYERLLPDYKGAIHEHYKGYPLSLQGAIDTLTYHYSWMDVPYGMAMNLTNVCKSNHFSNLFHE